MFRIDSTMHEINRNVLQKKWGLEPESPFASPLSAEQLSACIIRNSRRQIDARLV